MSGKQYLLSNPTIVVELGNSRIKAGLAGESMPRRVFDGDWHGEEKGWRIVGVDDGMASKGCLWKGYFRHFSEASSCSPSCSSSFSPSYSDNDLSREEWERRLCPLLRTVLSSVLLIQKPARHRVLVLASDLFVPRAFADALRRVLLDYLAVGAVLLVDSLRASLYCLPALASLPDTLPDHSPHTQTHGHALPARPSSPTSVASLGPTPKACLVVDLGTFEARCAVVALDAPPSVPPAALPASQPSVQPAAQLATGARLLLDTQVIVPAGYHSFLQAVLLSYHNWVQSSQEQSPQSKDKSSLSHHKSQEIKPSEHEENHPETDDNSTDKNYPETDENQPESQGKSPEENSPESEEKSPESEEKPPEPEENSPESKKDLPEPKKDLPESKKDLPESEKDLPEPEKDLPPSPQEIKWIKNATTFDIHSLIQTWKSINNNTTKKTSPIISTQPLQQTFDDFYTHPTSTLIHAILTCASSSPLDLRKSALHNILLIGGGSCALRHLDTETNDFCQQLQQALKEATQHNNGMNRFHSLRGAVHGTLSTETTSGEKVVVHGGVRVRYPDPFAPDMVSYLGGSVMGTLALNEEEWSMGTVEDSRMRLR